MVHLVWNVVPVVVKRVDALVRESQDDQIVAGPGRVQEDDDGSYNCHLAHRRPLRGLKRERNSISTIHPVWNHKNYMETEGKNSWAFVDSVKITRDPTVLYFLLVNAPKHKQSCTGTTLFALRDNHDVQSIYYMEISALSATREREVFHTLDSR